MAYDAPTEFESLFRADLERSGITVEHAELAGMFAVEDSGKVCDDFKALPAIVIPYRDPLTGEPMMFERNGEQQPFLRIRYLKEPQGKNSFIKKPKKQRYAQPASSGVHAYFPIVDAFDWETVFKDAEIPVLITEGEKKSLRACIAGIPCVGLGGVFNFISGDDLIPRLAELCCENRDVYICFDSDAEQNRDIQLAERRLAAAITKRKAKAWIARIEPLGNDKVGIDDLIVANGEQALFGVLEQAQLVKPGDALVVEGTDVEIADAVLRDIEDANNSSVVAAEGGLHVYSGNQWRSLDEHEIANAIYRYDGRKCGKRATIKLSDSRTRSIQAIMFNRAADPDFFADAPVGINCASGFITFDESGTPSLEPHAAGHRQRHCLPGHWADGDEWAGGGLLGKFLEGCFGADEDLAQRVDLIAEICGVAALGAATSMVEPKALVTFGQTAANGKSELLKIVSGLLPADAVCAVPPTRFGDERMIVKLIGAKLNACAELGTSHAIAADVFKSAITGDKIMGKEVYRKAVFFRPEALHLFATNTLPAFHGGIDRGVQRRLLVLSFNRSIPAKSQIMDIGTRIATDEADALLAFAVEGASRIARSGRFTEPPSSRETRNQWVFSADPVLAWLDSCATYKLGARTPTKAAFDHFMVWAEENGFRKDRLPASNNFVQRLMAQDGRVSTSRTRNERFIEGLSMRSTSKFSRFGQ